MHRFTRETLSVIQLKDMLARYPELIYFNDQDELIYQRKKLVKLLEERDIILTSFERGLKHSGMKVLSTTHGSNEFKRWGFKSERIMPPKKQKFNEIEIDFIFDDELPPLDIDVKISEIEFYLPKIKSE